MSALDRLLQQILNRLRRLEDDRTPPEPEAWVFGGSSLPGFYVAAEDIYPGRDWFWANPSNRKNDDIKTTVFEKVYDWDDILAHMRAGYHMLTEVVDGERCFKQAVCMPNACSTSTASITLTPESGEADAGTVGTSYTFSGISSSGLSGSITATGLPDGLTISGTTISGTPTTAGVYFVVLTGPVSSPAGCPVKRIVRIVINEAE